MANATATYSRPSEFTGAMGSNEAYSSGVSWAAVIAGAFIVAALSLILLALGTGIGLSSVSPWANAGASASTIGLMAIVWLVLTQIISSTMGGYLAGRLRTKWTNVHTDEVYFRDTVHGFLAWAVALVLTAGFLASASASLGGRAAQGSGTGNLSAAQSNGPELDPNQYFVDTLFRADNPAVQPSSPQGDASVRSEVGIILANDLRQSDAPMADKTYLANLVAARTGLSQADAARRVSDVLTQARQAADAARKSLAHAMYWTFLALLIGAFCASAAATWGGKQRDHVVTI